MNYIFAFKKWQHCLSSWVDTTNSKKWWLNSINTFWMMIVSTPSSSKMSVTSPNFTQQWSFSWPTSSVDPITTKVQLWRSYMKECRFDLNTFILHGSIWNQHFLSSNYLRNLSPIWRLRFISSLEILFRSRSEWFISCLHWFGSFDQ